MEQVKSTWREAVHELSASNRALESEMRRLNLAHAEALGTQEGLESQLRTAQSRLNISARKAGQLYVDNQALRAQLSAANISAAILPPSMGAAEPAPAEGFATASKRARDSAGSAGSPSHGANALARAPQDSEAAEGAPAVQSPSQELPPRNLTQSMDEEGGGEEEAAMEKARKVG